MPFFATASTFFAGAIGGPGALRLVDGIINLSLIGLWLKRLRAPYRLLLRRILK